MCLEPLDDRNSSCRCLIYSPKIKIIMKLSSYSRSGLAASGVYAILTHHNVE